MFPPCLARGKGLLCKETETTLRFVFTGKESSAYGHEEIDPALLLVFFLLLGAAESRAAFTMEDEMKLGRESYEKIKGRGLLIEDGEINEYLRRIGDLITEQGQETPFRFTYSVIDSRGINAFATPADTSTSTGDSSN